jgi:hypothetical protein
MDVYDMETWDRILPVSFSAIRGTIVSDYGTVLSHSAPWALDPW